MTEESASATADNVSQSVERNDSRGSAASAAARALVARLLKDEEIQAIGGHQAETLKQLGEIQERLSALNRKSSEEYNKYVSDFTRATRLATSLRGDLTEITRRIGTIRERLASIDQPVQTGALNETITEDQIHGNIKI